MNMYRRSLITAGVAIAALGFSWLAMAGGELREVNGRKYVAACPDKVATIDRKPGPYRVMVIGAHPDDADIVCGCLALKLVKKGMQVKFVSVTDGRMGHHRLSPDETAKTRRAETIEAAKRFGLDSYDIYGEPDCGLIPTYELRCRVAKEIRAFAPDFVITHRTCDYHVDHRATGTLVMDAGYLLGVPHWVSEAEPQRRRPVILYMSDMFTVPKEMRPDVLIDATPYIAKWCDGLDAQVSQFYDWLPWDKGAEAEVAAIGDRYQNIPARNAYLCKYWASRKVNDARRFADAWQKANPGSPVPKYVEAYEVSEYGRAPTQEDFDLLLKD